MMVTWCEIMQGAFFRSNREPERKARDFDDNKIVIKPDINQENLTGLSRHANRLRYHTKTGKPTEVSHKDRLQLNPSLARRLYSSPSECNINRANRKLSRSGCLYQSRAPSLKKK